MGRMANVLMSRSLNFLNSTKNKLINLFKNYTCQFKMPYAGLRVTNICQFSWDSNIEPCTPKSIALATISAIQ